MKKQSISKQDYKTWLFNLKQSIGNARLHTSFQVNANMLFVYWFIGNQIIQKVEKEKWGSGVIKQLAHDLQKAFPDTKGFSERNLKYMRQFAGIYSDLLIGQEPLAQLENRTKKRIQPSSNSTSPIGQEPLAQLQNSEKLFTQKPLSQISWSHHVALMDKIKNNA
ncbi:MAG: hypothetical protein JST67_03180 [Bacteroidetes bacterium]|nr:hypothetical protein [Bacteroidota bacterium]